MKSSKIKVQRLKKHQSLSIKGLIFNVCGLAVYKLVKSLCRTCIFCTESTTIPKYLTSQVFFIRSLYTPITQPLASFKQTVSYTYHLLLIGLSPLYTTPNINTKYIKE